MCLTGLDARFLQVNAALCRMLGYSASELLGGAWKKITHPDDIERSIQASLELRTAPSVEFEKRYIHKQGSIVWVRLKISRVMDQSGAASHYITHVEAITERKRAETAQRQSERRYRILFERNLAGVVRATLDGAILDCNDAFAQMLGYESPAELKTRCAADLYCVPADRQRIIETVRAEKLLRNIEVRMRRRDGSSLWIIMQASLADHEHGGPPTVETTLVDITERKLAGERVSLLLESTAEAIYGVDMRGNCSFANAACLRMLGYSDAGTLLGRNVHDVIHHSRADGSTYPVATCPVFRAFRVGEGSHIEAEVFWRADGTCFPSEYWSYPVCSAGEVVTRRA